MKYAQQIIKDLTAIGERQLAGEKKARQVIESFLKAHHIPYAVEEYDTYIPKYQEWGLTVDGKKIASEPTGYVSGKISSNAVVLSSLISSQKNIYDANINFNPAADKISRSNHYFAPSLAINRRDVRKVVMGKAVSGFLKVKKTKHRSANILVGNITNPSFIVFSHYDSVATGAVDNASGTALSLEYIVENPDALKNGLFALCGNEELSYDEPLYWGHGYRVFEETHTEQLETVKQIIVLDSFGHSKPQIITALNIVTLGFPIRSIERQLSKIKMVAGSLEGLMRFYHAANDVPKNITPENYAKTKQLFHRLIS
jgi:hypothetical protein